MAASKILQSLLMAAVILVSTHSASIQYPDNNSKLSTTKSTEPYSFDWMLNGSFLDTDSLRHNSSLSDYFIPDGVIIPKLRFTSPSVWEFEENFTNGMQYPWNCGGGGVQVQNGYATITRTSSGNSYCFHHTTASWYDGSWSTLAQNISMGQVSNNSYRGVKVGGVTNEETNWFVLTASTGNSILPFGEKDGFGIDCGIQTTPLPPTITGSQNWVEWRILIDHINREYMLYQGAFLRCKLPFFSEKNPSNDYISMNVWSNGSHTSASYDDMRASGGRFAPFSNGTWISPPLEKQLDNKWGELEIEWDWYGIGSFQDVRDSVRISIINETDGKPIVKFNQISPSLTPLNLSQIPTTSRISLRIDWLPNITGDLIALSSISYTEGDLRPPDLMFKGASLFWPTSNQPINFHSEFYANRMEGFSKTINFSLEFDNGARFTRDINSSIINTSHWGGWWTERYESGLLAGYHNVSAKLDYTDDWFEENEQNNYWNRSIFVTPSSGPNLTMRGKIASLSSETLFDLDREIEGIIINNITIIWGDGTEENIGYQTPISHIYNNVGEYEIIAFAEFENNYMSGISRLNISVGNEPPIANISLSQPWQQMPQVVRISCENSTDTEGEELTCEWLLDEGAPDGQWLSGTTLIHRYPTFGEKIIRLKVRDPFGATNETETKITLAPKETRRILSGVETISNSVVEGGIIYVRPLWSDQLAESERSNVTLRWLFEGVLIDVSLGLGGWYQFSAGTEPGLRGAALLAIFEGESDLEYDLSNFYFAVINTPPIVHASHNTNGTIIEDDVINIDWSKTTDDPWDELSVSLSIEPQTISWNWLVIDEGNISVSILESGLHTISIEVSDESTTSSFGIPILVVNKVPTAEPFCTVEESGETANISCIAMIDDTPSDLETITVSWNTPWGAKTGNEFNFVEITPGTPSVLPNLYQIDYELWDDDGARHGGLVLVSINTTQTDVEGGVFNFTPLYFPLFIFLVMFGIAGIALFLSSRRGLPKPGDKEWRKANPWNDFTDQTESVDEDNPDTDYQSNVDQIEDSKA